MGCNVCHMGYTAASQLAGIILAEISSQKKTIRSVAIASAIAPSTLHRRLNGRSEDLTANELGAIATELGTTPSALLLAAEQGAAA